jgi:hypothetical protein
MVDFEVALNACIFASSPDQLTIASKNRAEWLLVGVDRFPDPITIGIRVSAKAVLLKCRGFLVNYRRHETAPDKVVEQTGSCIIGRQHSRG